jgi:hypothetical protein
MPYDARFHRRSASIVGLVLLSKEKTLRTGAREGFYAACRRGLQALLFPLMAGQDQMQGPLGGTNVWDSWCGGAKQDLVYGVRDHEVGR